MSQNVIHRIPFRVKNGFHDHMQGMVFEVTNNFLTLPDNHPRALIDVDDEHALKIRIASIVGGLMCRSLGEHTIKLDKMSVHYTEGTRTPRYAIVADRSKRKTWWHHEKAEWGEIIAYKTGNGLDRNDFYRYDGDFSRIDDSLLFISKDVAEICRVQAEDAANTLMKNVRVLEVAHYRQTCRLIYNTTAEYIEPAA